MDTHPSSPPRRFGDALESAILSIDASRSRWLLFAALSAILLLMLAPTGWNANEEEYFQMSHRFVAPDTFSTNDAAFDRSHAQFLSKGILGYLVKGLGYERAHDVARIGMAILYAVGLTMLFGAAGVGIVDALLVVALFCLFGEQLIGGEWFFRGVEHKTFAYALLFIAFGMAWREKWLAAILLGGAATYMHFLTGGFWTGMVLFLQWHRAGIKAPPIKNALIYCALIAPLFFIIVADQFGGAAAPVDGPSADFIYSEIRNPHHVAPFQSWRSFVSWTPGLAITLCLLVTLLMLYRRRLLSVFGVAALGGLIFLVVAMVVSFFDRHNYFFGKFYLFRPSSLTLFLALASLVMLLRRHLAEQAQMAWILLAASVIACFSFNTLKSQVVDAHDPDALAFTPSLVGAITANSSAEQIVLLEPYMETSVEYVRLHRDIPRPTLVSWKFVPANRDEILRWYGLVRAREKLFADGCGKGIAIDPKPTLLLTFTARSGERMQSCGSVVWSEGDVRLIKVEG